MTSRNLDSHVAGMDEQAIFDGNTPENVSTIEEMKKRIWGAVLSVVVAAGLSTVVAFARTTRASAIDIAEAYMTRRNSGDSTLIIDDKDLLAGGADGGPDPKRQSDKDIGYASQAWQGDGMNKALLFDPGVISPIEVESVIGVSNYNPPIEAGMGHVARGRVLPVGRDYFATDIAAMVTEVAVTDLGLSAPDMEDVYVVQFQSDAAAKNGGRGGERRSGAIAIFQDPGSGNWFAMFDQRNGHDGPIVPGRSIGKLSVIPLIAVEEKGGRQVLKATTSKGEMIELMSAVGSQQVGLATSRLTLVTDANGQTRQVPLERYADPSRQLASASGPDGIVQAVLGTPVAPDTDPNSPDLSPAQRKDIEAYLNGYTVKGDKLLDLNGKQIPELKIVPSADGTNWEMGRIFEYDGDPNFYQPITKESIKVLPDGTLDFECWRYTPEGEWVRESYSTADGVNIEGKGEHLYTVAEMQKFLTNPANVDMSVTELVWDFLMKPFLRNGGGGNPGFEFNSIKEYKNQYYWGENFVPVPDGKGGYLLKPTSVFAVSELLQKPITIYFFVNSSGKADVRFGEGENLAPESMSDIHPKEWSPYYVDHTTKW